MKLIPLIFLITSVSTFGLSPEPLVAKKINQELTCISIAQDTDGGGKYAESGKFRNLVESDAMHSFSYSKNDSFSDYLDFARAKIEAENPKAMMPCPIQTEVSRTLFDGVAKNLQTTADLISPYELRSEGAKQGILLVHGLTDSPFMFHDLSAEFNKMGITVRTLLIPGHATAPEGLLDVSEKEWREATNFAVNSMLRDFDSVLLGGFSTGGALILDQVINAKRPKHEMEKLKGLILWAPALQAKSTLAWAAKYVDAIPFIDYETKSADVDFAKYESFPYNAAAQVHKLMKRIFDTKIPSHNIPLMVIMSELDQTVDSSKTLDFINRWAESRVGVSQHTKVTETPFVQDRLIYLGKRDKQASLPSKVNVKVLTCHQKHLCEKVIDISHNAAPISPNNPYYGFDGVYKNCEHVRNTKHFSSCKSESNKQLGEITKENLASYPDMARLTFNPYFQETVSEIELFIDVVKK